MSVNSNKAQTMGNVQHQDCMLHQHGSKFEGDFAE